MKPYIFSTCLSVVLAGILVGSVLLSCGEGGHQTPPPKSDSQTSHVHGDHQHQNTKPHPLVFKRLNEHEVEVGMTAQITDIRVDKNRTYKAWTFNGQAPGPLVVVKEGDVIHFTLKNDDPSMPHSMDFHAVEAAPSQKFIDVMPGKEGTFTYKASYPGVFMYHCGTMPVIQHIGNGMAGMIIVKPKNGYPTDQDVDREFVLIQNEWYKQNDYNDMVNGNPEQVVFSTKALHNGDRNTNGDTFSLKEHPLEAKAGETIRIYFANMGPNHSSALHVVGAVFKDVYINGNPYNHENGLQTVLVPASGSAVVEFTVKEPGRYMIMDHQLQDAEKGAVAYLNVK
jgi:nitrite reductase (NO-forming)